MPAFLRFLRLLCAGIISATAWGAALVRRSLERLPLMTAACALILAATLSSAPALEAAPEAWMLDRKVGRPGAVKALYGTLGILQALDVYSTQRALGRGGSEINPLMKKTAGNQAAMIAAKALSTAGAIYF